MFHPSSFSRRSFAPVSWAPVLVSQPPGTPAGAGDYIKWGYGPEIHPEKHEPVKTRLQLQNEALLMVLLH